ncbi:plasmid maintenance protein CcdB [Candidimonas sp. SYP-B2681]|uniref:CcdB family protein n=1 Tax=Candidimonas sp. SYP-B2681 TaxID=2497686 RepID=UPI000F8914FB|nr:CcdB family protein [Candidimonas sp. SYP-B2681]RTZ47614.1 plasmid maintenance protein CcdB [Candidimonas sp. SYP-B2681]
MSRYDVYPNPLGSGYLLDVQADILQPLNTRAVVPLLPLSEAPKPAKTLNPVFDIGGEPHAMVTQYIAAVPDRELQNPTCSLQQRHDDIMSAIDFLFYGF